MIKSLSKKPSFALAAMAVAVATAAPSAFSHEEIEEVVVTGSRIPVNTNTISSVPFSQSPKRTSATRVRSTLLISSPISLRWSRHSLLRTR